MTEAHKDKPFSERLSESRLWTDRWMEHLTEIEHFHEFKSATTKEDFEGIDYWVRFEPSDDWIPIQFKLRVTVSKRDCPVVMNQPFYGCDAEGNKVGRDYKGVVNDKSKFYYVAVKDSTGLYSEIYYIPTKTLKGIVLNIEEEWNNVKRDETKEKRDDKWSYKRENLDKAILSTIGSGTLQGNNYVAFLNKKKAQIFIQKNKGERFHKINCYVKESFKEKSFLIPKDVGAKAALDFKAH